MLKKELYSQWKSLIQSEKGTEREKKISILLRKMFKEAPYSYQEPMDTSIKYGDLEMVQVLLQKRISTRETNDYAFAGTFSTEKKFLFHYKFMHVGKCSIFMLMNTFL